MNKLNTTSTVAVPERPLARKPLLFICAPVRNGISELAGYLTAKSFNVRCIRESSAAVDEIITHMPDVVLLYAKLPAAGGYEVCSAVRPYYGGHILMLGHDVDEAAQLLAFEREADDYVILPTSPALLSARIKAHLKRRRCLAGQSKENQILAGDLILDGARREAYVAGHAVTLTSLQFELFWYLAKRSGRVVSRKELFEALYHEKYNGFDRAVDVHVSRIRHQLGDNADHPVYLKTVRGVGYLFVGNQPMN